MTINDKQGLMVKKAFKAAVNKGEKNPQLKGKIELNRNAIDWLGNVNDTVTDFQFGGMLWVLKNILGYSDSSLRGFYAMANA